jgi:hypothetical protein
MQKLNTSWGMLLLYSSFLVIASMLILIGMLLSPSEAGSSIVWGLSLPRLVLALGLLTVAVFFTIVSIKASRDHAWADRVMEQWLGEGRLRPILLLVAGISLGLGWIGCFLPSYRAGFLSVHWGRLQPVMVFLLLAGFATLALILVRRSNFRLRDLRLSRTYRASLILFFSCLLVIGLMLYTDFGVSAPEDYWYGAGVPILITQLLMAIIGGVLFLQADRKWGSKRFDLIVFLLIYGVTAIVWAREPLQRSFLFIGPYPPNRVLYPFADAAIFDAASQFALIGQNFFLFNGQFFERALYISFLVFLHSLFGQDYGQLMAAQAAIFAVFPALVYLVGKSLNSRALGFAAALVAAFRGANAIAASNMIDMANPKMMLTDFPTAIGVALIVLFACEWLKRPRERWNYALWIGGVIGLTIMLRTNTLVFLLLIPLYMLLTFSRQWKIWVVTSFLIVFAAFAITLPWELRNQALGGQMYGSIVSKFENVIQRRYTPPVSPDSLLPQQEILSFLSWKQSQAVLELSRPIDILQEPSCNSTACFVPNHFLHNVLTSILVLPTSPVLDDLRHTVKERFSYWSPDWDGTFTIPAFFFFALNLFFILLGIRTAWEGQRLAGLVPLAIFMFYNLSNGFARTSGGRYIVPIDWILTIYFLIGLFRTLLLFAGVLRFRWMSFPERSETNALAQSRTSSSLASAVVILVVLFGLGGLIPLAETLHPERYANFDVAKTLSEHESQIASAGLSLPEIDSFLNNPNAEISVGRALYPRYYIEFEGEVHFYPVVVMGFPRTTFTLIGPDGEKGIVLPGEKPDHFPHAVDTIVLGCKEEFYVDALAVIVLDDTGSVYTRNPASPLQCPLKQPVCDNNHHCN